MNERGSIAPLIAGYLALILLASFGAIAVGAGIIASHRVQGVADFAVLYAHDRSVTAGIPNLTDLRRELQEFLRVAPSAKSLKIEVADVTAVGEISELRLCARYRDVLFGLESYLICKSSRAQSFVVP